MKNMDIETVCAEFGTASFRARFSPEVNNFVELTNLRTGDNYMKQSPAHPVIELYGLEGKEKKQLMPGVPCVTVRDQRMHLVYDSFGGLPIAADLICTAEADRLTIHISVENHSNMDIVEVLAPHIGGIYLGNTYEDDTIIYPHHAGERTVNPVLGYGQNKKDFWRASSVACGDFFRREINYCGLASMSWMYYYDCENGLYVGSHDQRFPVTGIIAETSGVSEHPWMAFGFRKHHRIRPGEAYDAGEYVLAVTTRDWHYGAEIYREYIAPCLNFDHNPEFLEDEYALNQCYNFKRTGNIEHTFREIPDLYKQGADWGVRHMFLASWNRTGFDSFYPEYYPDMELGSAMEFRRGLEYVRRQGGFSTLYINARIFDKKSDFHKSVGEKMAIRNERGEAYSETYGPEHFTVNCPSDQLWREYLLDTAEFCVKAYGCDGIYLDQLASAEPFACYCEEHSHDDIGQFNNGYVYVLRELMQRLRAYNPNAYIMTENCGDIYGSYTWGNLTWNGADYDEYYNVFKYTFPEFTQVNMVNPRGWEKDNQKRQSWFYRDLHRAIALGSVLWMGITTRLRPEDGIYHAGAKKALAFRKSLQPLLKGAEFLDNAWLGDIPEACQGTCWNLADGRRMVLAANDTDAPVMFRVNCGEPAKSVRFAVIDGAEPAVKMGDDDISFILEPGQMCRTLIEG